MTPELQSTLIFLLALAAFGLLASLALFFLALAWRVWRTLLPARRAPEVVAREKKIAQERAKVGRVDV